jgi:hypothetical protein
MSAGVNELSHVAHGSVLFAPVWLYLILRTDYERLVGLFVRWSKSPESIKHRSLLMYLEAQNLNDHKTLDMVQVTGKTKTEAEI